MLFEASAFDSYAFPFKILESLVSVGWFSAKNRSKKKLMRKNTRNFQSKLFTLMPNSNTTLNKMQLNLSCTLTHIALGTWRYVYVYCHIKDGMRSNFVWSTLVSNKKTPRKSNKTHSHFCHLKQITNGLFLWLILFKWWLSIDLTWDCGFRLVRATHRLFYVFCLESIAFNWSYKKNKRFV